MPFSFGVFDFLSLLLFDISSGKSCGGGLGVSFQMCSTGLNNVNWLWGNDGSTGWVVDEGNGVHMGSSVSVGEPGVGVTEVAWESGVGQHGLCLLGLTLLHSVCC